MLRLLLGSTLFLVLACQEPPKKAPPPAADTKSSAASRIKRVSTAVAPGTQVPCEALFDAKEVGKLSGLEIDKMRDDSAKNKRLTAKCEFLRAGKAPSKRAQEAKARNSGLRLGVLPGDVYCNVELNCSLFEDSEAFRKKCREKGDELTEELGTDTCVHKTQASADWSYRMTALHRETKCRLVVRGGPSVTDREVVKQCGMALLPQINMEKLDAATAK